MYSKAEVLQFSRYLNERERKLFDSYNLQWTYEYICNFSEIYKKNMTTVFLAVESRNEEHIQVELITHRVVGPDPTERLLLDIWTPKDSCAMQTCILTRSLTS